MIDEKKFDADSIDAETEHDVGAEQICPNEASPGVRSTSYTPEEFTADDIFKLNRLGTEAFWNALANLPKEPILDIQGDYTPDLYIQRNSRSHREYFTKAEQLTIHSGSRLLYPASAIKDPRDWGSETRRWYVIAKEISITGPISFGLAPLTINNGKRGKDGKHGDHGSGYYGGRHGNHGEHGGHGDLGRKGDNPLRPFLYFMADKVNFDPTSRVDINMDLPDVGRSGDGGNGGNGGRGGPGLGGDSGPLSCNRQPGNGGNGGAGGLPGGFWNAHTGPQGGWVFFVGKRDDGLRFFSDDISLSGSMGPPASSPGNKGFNGRGGRRGHRRGHCQAKARNGASYNYPDPQWPPVRSPNRGLNGKVILGIVPNVSALFR